MKVQTNSEITEVSLTQKYIQDDPQSDNFVENKCKAGHCNEITYRRVKICARCMI